MSASDRWKDAPPSHPSVYNSMLERFTGLTNSGARRTDHRVLFAESVSASHNPSRTLRIIRRRVEYSRQPTGSAGRFVCQHAETRQKRSQPA